MKSAGRRDPIAARRSDAAHRDDDRDVLRLGLEQRLADALGREHRSARAVDADDQRLDALVEPVLDLLGDRVAAGGPGRGLAVDDHRRRSVTTPIGPFEFRSTTFSDT